MQQQAEPTYGVDVSKAELVVAQDGRPELTRVVANQAHAIQTWLDTLPPRCTVAMEATGIYHGTLARLAHASGRRVFVLNARDVFHYARALNGRGKTDRLDAPVIARFAAAQQDRLHPWRPLPPLQQQLLQLLRRRAEIAGLRVALVQTLRDVPDIQEVAEDLLKGFKSFFGKVDEQIRSLLSQDEELLRRAENLSSITGVGLQGTAMLATVFSGIAFDNADAVVAYSGLDPRPDDSGTKRGRRKLSKRGPAWLRKQLFMMGFTASHSKALRPLYLALTARGFASTEAINILARKLLRVAWAMWKSGKPFDVSLIGKKPQAAAA